jgi:hypothetical protein
MKFKREKRESVKSISCPHCDGIIEYYNYSGMGDLAPHFYCDLCSNIFFRESDRTKIYGKDLTEELLSEITEDLPRCICGGQFKAGANPKCPHCKKDLDHKHNPVQRLADTYVIQVKGAYLLQPEGNSS